MEGERAGQAVAGRAGQAVAEPAGRGPEGRTAVPEQMAAEDSPDNTASVGQKQDSSVGSFRFLVRWAA